MSEEEVSTPTVSRVVTIDMNDGVRPGNSQVNTRLMHSDKRLVEGAARLSGLTLTTYLRRAIVLVAKAITGSIDIASPEYAAMLKRKTISLERDNQAYGEDEPLPPEPLRAAPYVVDHDPKDVEQFKIRKLLPDPSPFSTALPPGVKKG